MKLWYYENVVTLCCVSRFFFFFWFSQLCLAKIHYFTYNFLKLTFCIYIYIYIGQTLSKKLVVVLGYNLTQYFFIGGEF